MKKIVTLLLTLAAAYTVTAQEPVSIKSLLGEMVDRTEKARFPSPRFTCKQFSSYDRLTTEKGKPGWFGNWDRTQFIAVEQNDGRREFVMMDAKGPGAIPPFRGMSYNASAAQLVAMLNIGSISVKTE